MIDTTLYKPKNSVPIIDKKRYLKIIEIALKDNRTIDTTNMSIQDWLAIRQLLGIGASEVSGVLGISRYKTPYQIWVHKVSDEIELVENKFTIWGNLLEEPLAQEYVRKTGNLVKTDNKIRIHQKHDNIFANLDRVVVEKRTEENGILECKSTVKRVYESWIKNEEDCPQGIPLDYYCQIQQQLSVTGFPWCDLIIGILDERETYIKRILPDKKYIEKQNDVIQAWWNGHVIEMIPPEMTADEYNYVEPAIGSVIEADEEVAEIVSKLKERKTEYKGMEKEIKSLEDSLKSFLGDNENLTLAGNILATWKQQSRDGIDNRLLKEKYPEIAEEVKKVSVFRVLRIK